MSKNIKPGFVIKLSEETVQKLAEEDQQSKANSDASSNPDSITVLATQTSEKVSDNNEDLKEQSKPPDKDSSKLENKILEQKTLVDDKSETETIPSTDSWGDYAPYVTYEGEQSVYTDPSTSQKYTWNKSTKSWDANDSTVPEKVYSYENDTHVYTEADGSKFFWDDVKKAWIPKVDDDFLAYYQMSYGFIDNSKIETKEEDDDKDKTNTTDDKKDPAGVKRKTEPQWFQPSDETNTKVYVSNLPLDLTEEEFVNFMQKCGLVERDLATQKMKVKLYEDKEQKCFKGDALCTYIKIESVELALKILDGSDFKGNKIKVERAHFQMKGDYNPALKPKKRKKKELEKIKKMQQKLFDWRPEKFIGERSKHERVVIIKNLFHPTDFDKEVQLILDYQQDLREECSKCGEVRKVVIYDRHPEGVAQVTMKEPEQADAVIQLINGRWFGKRQITAEIWDGKTKYKIAETDADINQRINKWEKFLDGKENEKKDLAKNEEAVVSTSDVTTQEHKEKSVDDNNMLPDNELKT